jgi:predicted nucleotidyltransferase component of viral defense system
MPRLRERPDDLLALVSSASDAKRMPRDFVEKDFWVTEVLRATISAAQANNALAIFKGGTSLSKAFELLERFSEDVDVLLVLPDGLGETARHTIIKRICAAVGDHLGVALEVKESETGMKRNVRYPYEQRFESTALQPGVLLEMGIRGGPEPHHRVTLRSIVAQHALALGSSERDFEEFLPIKVDVLATERTLVEKLSLLHHVAAHFADSDQARLDLRRSGRHYYDVYQLLGHSATQRAISEKGVVTDLALDVATNSRRFGWPHTDRPADGYASSPAFNPGDACQEVVRPAYEDVRRLVYGRYPTLDECIARVKESAGLL